MSSDMLDTQIRRTARRMADHGDLESMARLLDRARAELTVLERARRIVDRLPDDERETVLEAVRYASDYGLSLDGQIELRRLVEPVVRLAAAS